VIKLVLLRQGATILHYSVVDDLSTVCGAQQTKDTALVELRAGDPLDGIALCMICKSRIPNVAK
jgi:hypothetical protein